MVVVLFAFLKERVIRSIKIFNHLSVCLSKLVRYEFKSQNIKKTSDWRLNLKAIWLFLIGISTNEVIFDWDLNESTIFVSRFRLIRFLEPGMGVDREVWSWVSHESSFFSFWSQKMRFIEIGILANEVFLGCWF